MDNLHFRNIIPSTNLRAQLTGQVAHLQTVQEFYDWAYEIIIMFWENDTWYVQTSAPQHEKGM